MVRIIASLIALLFTLTVQAASIQNVISQQGQPNLLVNSRDGTQLYIYITQIKPNIPQTQTQIMVGPGGQSFGVNVPAPASQQQYITKCTTTYKVNKQGKIVNVDQSGNC